jgi:hypothetical protein
MRQGETDRTRILNDITHYQARVDKLPLREQEMAGLTRDYHIARTNYSSLLDKKIAAEMASDLERRQKGERFTILDPARVPEKPAKPNRRLLYAASLLAGIVLGALAAIARGLAGDRLLGEWELPKDVLLLGRVPHISMASTRTRSRPGGRWLRHLQTSACLLTAVASARLLVARNPFWS